MDAKNGEAEADVTTHLEYELSEYSKLLTKALVDTRGQRTLLKRLYSDRDEVVEHCSVDELRRAVWEPSLLSSLEGRKLAASFAPKIGIKNFWELTKKVLMLPSTIKLHCQRYGEVFVFTWKQAARDPEKASIQNEIECHLFMDLVFHALCHDYSKKFFAALDPLKKMRNKQLNSMIYRIFEPNLWRSLKAANDFVRFNACCLFLPFYPLLTDDDFENAEHVANQQKIMMDLLKDDCHGIRAEACRRMLYILNIFWDSFSTSYIKNCLTQIVDRLSVDHVTSVRLAVYEGMRQLLNCSNAINACEQALKCLFHKKGINDKSLGVRLAAFQLLNALKGHRFIKMWDILSMDSILQCFTLEDSSLVKAEIAKLILRSYKPAGTSFDEVVRRILVMGKCNCEAPPFFHYYLVNKKLISTEEAIEHIKHLTITVYKAFRSFEGREIADEDTIITNASQTIFVEPSQEDESENAKKWRSTNLLLNCLVVMWDPLRADLMDQKYSKDNGVLRKLLTKLFKYTFLRYKGSSMLSSVVCLGKTLDVWKDAESMIFNELQQAQLTNDVAHMYLELLASWDFLAVLKFIDSAIENMKKKLSNEPTLNKEEWKQKVSTVDEFRRTIPYLRHIFKSSSLRHNLMQNNNIFVKKFHQSIIFINQRITETYLTSAANDPHEMIDGEIILEVIVLRYTIGCALLTDDQKNMEENEKKEIIECITGDVNWVENTLLPFLSNERSSQHAKFMNTLLEVFLFLWGQYLKGFDADDDFKLSVYKVLKSLCSDASLPCTSLITAINTLQSLISISLTETRYEGVNKVITDCLRWLLNRCEQEDFDEKGSFNAWSSLINVLEAAGIFTQQLKHSYVKILVTDVLEKLATLNAKTTIKNPWEACFDPGPKVQFCMKKLLRGYPLRCISLNIIDEKIESLCSMKQHSEKETKPQKYNLISSSVGALVQFILLIHKSLPEIANGREKSIVRSIAVDCVSNMETLEVLCTRMGFTEIRSLGEQLGKTHI